MITLTSDPVALLVGFAVATSFVWGGYSLMTNPERLWGALMDLTDMKPATARLYGFFSLAVGIALLSILVIGLVERVSSTN